MGNRPMRAALLAVVVASFGGAAVRAEAPPLLPQISLPHVTPPAAPLTPVPGLPHVFAPQPLGPPLLFGPAPAATTVQLPTFAFFASSSTVWVPDSGGTHLGGVGRSSTGSTAYGPGFGLPNRLMDARSAATNTSVHATIHDLGELDAAVLRQAGGLPGHTAAAPQGSPAAPAARAPALVSVAEARQQFQAQQEARQNEALHYLRQAEAAAAAGNTGAARVYYQMAARRATGPLLDDIHLRLRELNNTSSSLPNRVGRP